MANGKAYGFAFDDVLAQESLVHDGNPSAAYIQLDPFQGAATPIAGSDGGGGDGGTSPLPAGHRARCTPPTACASTCPGPTRSTATRSRS